MAATDARAHWSWHYDILSSIVVIVVSISDNNAVVFVRIDLQVTAQARGGFVLLAACAVVVFARFNSTKIGGSLGGINEVAGVRALTFRNYRDNV